MGVVEFIIDNSAILGLVIAILSIFLAYFFYLRSQKFRNPNYAIRNINLIRDLVGKFGDLEISYEGRPIENLTATKVAFWNAGKETINNSDVAQANPLEIFVEDKYEILNAKTIFSKNPVNQLDVKLSDNHKFVKILFDYLDQYEGGVIQVLHTGKTSEAIGVRGSIKGVKKLVCTSSPSQSRLSRIFVKIPFTNTPTKFLRFMGTFFFLAPFIFGFIIFFLMPNLIPTTNSIESLNCVSEKINQTEPGMWCTPLSTPILSSKTLSWMFPTFLILIVIPYWLMAYSLLKRRIPKGFDIFEEDV